MSIYGVCGTVEDEIDLIKGNGKTITIVFFCAIAFLAGKKVFTNFKTSFSICMTIEEIIEMVTNEIIRCNKNNIPLEQSPLYGLVIGFDELDKYLNSLGSKAIVINFVDRMVSQIRKIGGTIYHTEQRWSNLHRRMRLHSEQILKPAKLHYMPPHGDGKYCYLDNCDKLHVVEVKSFYPYREKPLIMIDCSIVGKWYNTREFIADLPDVKKIKEMMKC